MRLLPFLLLAACSGAQLKQECDGADDTECVEARVKLPADPNLKVGRDAPGVSLGTLIEQARAKDPKAQLVYLVDKSERALIVKLGAREIRRYGVSLGWTPSGDKTRQGDGRTPEGEFYIVYGAPPRYTRYHRSLLISYPTPARAKEGRAAGAISKATEAKVVRAHKRCATPPQSTRLGGYILIHGGGGGPGYGDWTAGCVALTNDDIEALHAAAQSGCAKGQARTKVIIQP